MTPEESAVKAWEPQTDAERLAFSYLRMYCPDKTDRGRVEILARLLKDEFRRGIRSAVECYEAGLKAGRK